MWVLILFAHVGMLGDGNSNALTTAEFNFEKTCMEAGQRAQALAKGSVKEIAFICARK